MSEQHRIVASTRLIAALTLVSRILGLAREMVYAHFFGTGPLLSAFRIAFMVPNLSRRLFGEGALSAAFIPVISRVLHQRGQPQAERLTGAVLTLLVLVLGGLLVILEIGLITAHGFRPGPALRLTAIMLPFMAFICVVALLGGVLNVLGRFAAPSAAPILLNALVIVSILLGAQATEWTPTALIHLTCAAVLLAGVAQVALQWFALRAAGFRVLPNRDWNQPAIREIIAAMAPMMIGLSAMQINTVFDMLIAWLFVPDGEGPAVLGYAQFLYQLPLGVFGIALATAIFPVLAARAAAGDLRGLAGALQRGARLSFFITLPASVGLMLIADPLVSLFFERGRFGSMGSARTSSALVFYAVGLCAYSFQHIIVRTFYALGRHGTAARVAGVAVGVNLAVNLLLVRPLGEAGVALGTVASACVQVVCLTLLLRSRIPAFDRTTLVRSMGRTTVATAVMAVPVWLIAAETGPLAVAGWSPLLRVGAGVVAGCVVFAVVAGWLRSSDLAELLRRRRTPPELR